MAPDGEKYRHWRFEEDDERIVWLIFDRADKNVNALSREVLEELARVLEEIARHRPKGLVVRSGKTNGFIAGADVTEFTELTDEGAALALIERGRRSSPSWNVFRSPPSPSSAASASGEDWNWRSPAATGSPPTPRRPSSASPR